MTYFLQLGGDLTTRGDIGDVSIDILYIDDIRIYI